MPIELVEIVNPNGRKGRVAATSPAAAAYKRSPSTRGASSDDYPAGPPTDEWTVKQLTAYAEATGISLDDLGARPAKADILAAVTTDADTAPTADLDTQSSTSTNTSNDESQED